MYSTYRELLQLGRTKLILSAPKELHWLKTSFKDFTMRVK